ncbi:MAG TPA: DUF883 family protein [Steroidobacteraceae bacterium]|nr:DUF883 family protein [Steroidobacteraceae bacterium]
MAETMSAASEELAEELSHVVQEAEALLRALADDGDATLGTLRDRVHDSLDSAKARLADLQLGAQRAGKRAASAAQGWVQQNPWTAIAIAAGLGLLIGALLTRRGE